MKSIKLSVYLATLMLAIAVMGTGCKSHQTINRYTNHPVINQCGQKVGDYTSTETIVQDGYAPQIAVSGAYYGQPSSPTTTVVATGTGGYRDGGYWGPENHWNDGIPAAAIGGSVSHGNVTSLPTHYNNRGGDNHIPAVAFSGK